jgi:hypothetical protein
MERLSASFMMTYKGKIEPGGSNANQLSGNGAHWDLEISSIFELIGVRSKPGWYCLMMFLIIQGLRTLFGLRGQQGIAKLLGLPENQLDHMILLRSWRKTKDLWSSKFVTFGPAEENVDIETR